MPDRRAVSQAQIDDIHRRLSVLEEIASELKDIKSFVQSAARGYEMFEKLTNFCLKVVKVFALFAFGIAALKADLRAVMEWCVGLIRR